MSTAHAHDVCRTGTIKRGRGRRIERRRTKKQVNQLDTQILQVIQADHPQSVRHLFYRMTDPRLPEPVEKSDRGYRHIQDRVVKLRRRGQVPYYWITDASRSGYFTTTYPDAFAFLQSVKGLYRQDLWQHADYYCEVWTESRSIAGVVLDDCRELAVSLYPAGGFTSISLAYQAAEYINDTYDGRPVVIFYIGDYDPAGVLIDVALERELREHLAADVELIFRRVGITEEQIEAYDLSTKPRKEQDKRSPQIAATVEAEAMPAGIMRDLLRSEIEALLPPRAAEVARAAERSERAWIERLLSSGGAA
jgi:hypothetical protein